MEKGWNHQRKPSVYRKLSYSLHPPTTKIIPTGTPTPSRLPLKDGFWSKTDVETVKENYAARLKQIEFNRESVKVVEIDDVVVAVASEYRAVRDRAREIDARAAPRLAESTSAEEIKAAMDAAALTDLSTIVGSEPDMDVLRREAGFGAQQ